jgi:transposase
MVKLPERAITLSTTCRSELLALAGDARTRPQVSRRARSILMAADGANAAHVAEQLSLTRLTVYKWRRRYRALGAPGLFDLARPGQPRKLDSDRRLEIVRLTKNTIPPDAPRWSTRRLARFVGTTEHQVRSIWRSANLVPKGLDAISCAPWLGSSSLRGVWLEPNACVALFEVNELHVDSAAFTTPITLAHASASANALELAQRFAASYAQNSTRFLVRHDASDDVLSKTLRCGVTAIARVAIASDWLALIEWRERNVAPESEPVAARTFATTLQSYASLGSTNRHSIVTPAR